MLPVVALKVAQCHHSSLLRLFLLPSCCWSRKRATANADLRCVPPAADLGEIRGGPARQQRFELVNDGPSTIEIIDLQRGCGCLEPQLDRTTLAPGAKASLVVALRTTGQPNGPRSWNLRIRYIGKAMRDARRA